VHAERSADGVAGAGGDTAVLVTGGTSGMGLETAVSLAKLGHLVVTAGRSVAKLSSAKRRFADEGVAHRVEVAQGDMSVEDDVIRIVGTVGDLGRLVGVAAFAGGSDLLGPIVATPLADWRRVIDQNLTTAFLTLKHAGRLMARTGGGSIVLISSISGADTHRWLGPYAVGKAAVEALARLGSAELGASEVRVNTVRPGLIATDYVGHITADPQALDLFVSQQSIRRVGMPIDVVQAVLWLLSEASGFITGEVISVDGGSSARGDVDLSAFARELYSDEALAGRVDTDGPADASAGERSSRSD